MRISRNGVGAPPEWRSDGKELYYLSLDHKLMAATLDVRGELIQVTATQPLFSVKTGSDLGRRQYQASNDGEKFLVNAVVEDPTLRLISVILNWKPPAKN